MTFGGTLGAVGGGSGGGGGSASDFAPYYFADIASDGDPSSLVGAASSAGDSGEFLSFEVASGVAATTVGAMAYWEWDIKDWLGAELDGVSAEDLCRVLVQWLDGTLPAGLRLGVALTDAGMAAVQQGFAVGVQMHQPTLTMYCWEARCSAGTWAAINTGPAAWTLQKSVEGVAVLDEASNRMKVTAQPWDVTLLPGPTGLASLGTTASQNANGTYTKIALLVGTSAALAAATTIRACIKSLLAKHATMPGVARRAVPAVVPRFPSDGDYVLGVGGGHSYGNGYNADSPSLGGAATSTGLTNPVVVRDDGTTVTTWADTVSLGVGFGPYLIGLFDAWTGNTGNTLVRRCTNGAEISDRTNLECDEDVGGMLCTDAAAIGVTRYDCWVLPVGINDAKDPTLAANLAFWLRREIQIIRDHSPNCIIYLFEDEGTATHLATVEAAKAAVAAEFEYVFYLEGLYTGEVLDGDGHPSDAGHQMIAAAIDADLQARAAA